MQRLYLCSVCLYVISAREQAQAAHKRRVDVSSHAVADSLSSIDPLASLATILLGVAPAMQKQSASKSPMRHVASRRQSLGLGASLLVAATTAPRAAYAVDPNDLTRFRTGLDGVNYLLDNWDKETIDPNTGNDSPDKVRVYLGLRTTDHPLFQIDKLLAGAQKKLPDDVDIEEWIETVEGLQKHIAEVNDLAYTSSFGEYNPGGGKDQVRKYLLLA